jgi:uncharacterized protein (DUF1501 family)
MIKILGHGACDCDGITRRSFLQAGVLGLGGLLLPDFLRAQEAQAATGSAKPEQTAVILIWLSGGPGHMETWDPKPDAPSEYRGPIGCMQSKVPGILVSDLMPEQARIMDRLAIIRSVNHSSGDHTKSNHTMLTGFEGPAFNSNDLRQLNPSMGSITAKMRGANRSGMPPYVAVPNLRGGTDNFYHYAAYLGGEHNPFVVNSDPNDASYAVRDLTAPPGLTLGRLQNRRMLQEQLDAYTRGVDRRMDDMDGYYQRAYDMLTTPATRQAFNISAETDKVRDRYGRHTFGQSALVARRLVEAGVTFVTVNCVPWDHHGTPPQMQTEEGARKLIPPLDRAIAALVEDLEQRGLFDRTLVVAMGEFGRTPKMNRDAGRDHWGYTFSVLMANGRMRMGQAIGVSDARGEYVKERPVSPQDVAATVYHHLGIDARNTLIPDYFDRPIPILASGEPIRELVG